MYANLAIHRLSHPWKEDNKHQEAFSHPSADKQTINYGKNCSNHHTKISLENYQKNASQTLPCSERR